MSDQKKAVKRQIEAVGATDCPVCTDMKEDMPKKLQGLNAEFKYNDYFSDRGKQMEQAAGENFKGTPYFEDCIKDEQGNDIACRKVTGYNKDKSFAKMTQDNYLQDLDGVDAT